MTRIICGVDVSKARLDSFAAGAFESFANDAEGIAELAGFCRRQGVELVVMEASGGYERSAYLLLWEAGQPCALANPRQVRRFAEAMGVLEKTDRLDAALIARFAQARDLQPSPPPSADQQRLRALVGRLGQLTCDLTVQKQRLATAHQAEVRASLEEVIAFLKRQARRLEGEIASLIDDDPLWAAIAASWRTTKGVAGRTVARLMADMPELGLWSNKAVAKLAGLAPLADSGQRQGPRRTRGGRAPVRSILYLVADIARRYDPDLEQFAQRLRDKGKPKMVVRIALARKLLVRLNAKARDARIAVANAA